MRFRVAGLGPKGGKPDLGGVTYANVDQAHIRRDDTVCTAHAVAPPDVTHHVRHCIGDRTTADPDP